MNKPDYEKIEEELKVACPLCGQEGYLSEDFVKEAPLSILSTPELGRTGDLRWGWDSYSDPDYSQERIYAHSCGCLIGADDFEEAVIKAVGMLEGDPVLVDGGDV